MLRIEAFLFDEENESKFAVHGLRASQVNQTLDYAFMVVPNRAARRAAYLLIGRDHGGTCIAIPIEATYDPALWRPVTAWPCKASEQTKLGHKRSR